MTTDFDEDEEYATSVLVQPDGKIVAAGWARDGGDWDFAVARYLPDGRLDTGFDGDGRKTVGFGGGDGCDAMTLLEDGKLLLVGEAGSGLLDGSDSDFGLVRLDPDGRLDSTFDFDGKMSTGFGNFFDQAHAVLVQPDGKVVVVGYDLGEPFSKFLVARYLPDGQLDPSLDDDGKLTVPVGMDPRAVVVQLDGKIVVVGEHATSGFETRQILVTRLLVDGTPDATFDQDGHLFVENPSRGSGNAAALLPDGRILVCGSSAGGVLLRLLPDGFIDDNGRQTLAFEDAVMGHGADERAHGMTVDAEGRAILAGEIVNREGNESDFALARFTPDGAIDRSFGEAGRLRFGFAAREGARAIALQPDGRIVAAGYTQAAGNADFMVARFTADGSADSTFALFSYNVADFFGGDDIASGVAIAPDEKVVVGGHVWDGSHFVFAAARFTKGGVLDLTFSGDGKATANLGPEAQEAHAIAVKPDGTVLVAGAWKGDSVIMRWNEDGSVSRGALIVTDFGKAEGISALALAPDGGIVAAGYSSQPPLRGMDFAVARYTPGGVLDTTFGTGGKVNIEVAVTSTAKSVAIRGDGRIAVAGCADALLAVVQLTHDGDLDAGFGNGGLATTSFGGSAHCATAVAFAGRDRILAGGYQWAGSDANFAVARFVTSPAECEGAACGGGRQVPSDANQDARLDISDAVWLLGHLFSGTNPTLPCGGGTAGSPGAGARALLDANADSRIDISDAVRVLGFLFGGSQPPALGTSCTPIAGCPDRC